MGTLYTDLVDNVPGNAALFNSRFQQLETAFLAGPGAWGPLVSWTTLGITTASVTLSAIPGTYKALLLRLLLRSTVAAVSDTLLLQPNADTTAANMYTRRVAINTSVTVATQLASGTGLDMGSVLPGASALASHYAPIDIYIFDYANASNPKQWMYEAYTHTADAAASMTRHVGGGVWKGTAAITSLRFLPGTGSFAAGSAYALYRLG